MAKIKLDLNLLASCMLLIASTNTYATCITNSSTISQPSIGLQTSAANECLLNQAQGIISITGYYNGNGNYSTDFVGMYASHNGNTVTNYGTITSTGSGISNNNGSSFNYGVINAYSGITSAYGHGLSANYGSIFPTDSGVGIEGGETIINTGLIRSSAGGNVWGVWSFNQAHASSSVTNSGLIDINNGSNAIGVYISGNNTTLINSGTISVEGNNPIAILVSNAVYYDGIYRNSYLNYHSLGNNNTVKLLKGSVIIGDIRADLGALNSILNINLGSGASYAYSVTGPWTVTDLDNRPMVTGSAYAAGIGAQETASEMLYQRTSSITSALDRRLRSYASNETDNQPYWLDVYYADVSRNAGANYSTRTAFSNHNYGMTAGFKLPYEMTPLELVINAEQSHLNIDSSNQKVNSTSLMVGVLAPNISDVQGAVLSAKAIIGFANNDGDRKVMTNSLSYDGSRQIKSDYDSFYATVGTALTKLHPINDRLTLDAIVGLDININRIQSYAETDYFTWNDRTLTQLQSRVQAGLDYKLWGDKGSVFARAGVERRDLIGGKTQDYAINGTSVSFNTNNKNDTYLTAQVGIKAQLEKRFQLFGVLNTLHSEDSVDSLSGNIGLRADF